MTHKIHEFAAELHSLFEERMGIKARSLAGQVHKAGPKLPRSVRRSAKDFVRTLELMGHPKLERTIDEAKASADAHRVAEHLLAIDPRTVRIDRWLRIAAKISAVGICVFVAVVYFGHRAGKF